MIDITVRNKKLGYVDAETRVVAINVDANPEKALRKVEKLWRDGDLGTVPKPLIVRDDRPLMLNAWSLVYAEG